MKVSLNALKRHLDFDVSVEELNEIFPMLGLEVESADHLGLADLPKVVVGEVLKKDKHPDADKLTVCEVNVGEAEPLQIVCGAKNFKEGDRVPVALVGAKLPNGLKIKKGKLRGVASHGMMCSADELGLGDGAAGLYILEDKPEVGKPIKEAIEVEEDTVFDLELTANRGDCASHRGVARELAAYFGKTLKALETPAVEVSEKTNLPIEVQNPQGCPYYTAYRISGVEVKESPAWLKSHLESIGLRPVNNIVDVTNFIMMDLGQPLHAFDHDKIKSKIVVRNAADGEVIKTLDEKEHKLDAQTLVIADADRAIGIAGIMGSLDSEVSESTKDVILEAAYFDPSIVKRAARRLGLHSDSGYRFARDVDPGMTVQAASEAIKLITELAGGKAEPAGYVFGKAPRGAQVIEIGLDFIIDRCGFEVEAGDVERIYKGLGFGVQGDAKKWTVTVPTFRNEVLRPIDLVEEFVRVYGTDKIPEAPVCSVGLSREDNCDAVVAVLAADYLSSNGFLEFYNYSFIDSEKGGIALDNPLTAEHTHVRSTLLHGLLEGMKLNQNRGNEICGCFETGRVLRKRADGSLGEYFSIAFLKKENTALRNWKDRADKDFFSIKNTTTEVARRFNFKPSELEFKAMPEMSLWQEGHSAVVGDLGKENYELNCGVLDLKYTKELGIEGTVLAGECLIEREYLITRKSTRQRFEDFSHFPSVKKDLALLVDADKPADEVRREVAGLVKNDLLEDVRIFDLYEGEGMEPGKKSVGLEFEFRASDRTLTDKEVMSVFDAVIEAIAKTGDFTVRTS